MHELGAIGNEISREVQGRLRELVQFRDVGGFETDVESGEIVLQLRKRPGPDDGRGNTWARLHPGERHPRHRGAQGLGNSGHRFKKVVREQPKPAPQGKYTTRP